MRPELNTAEHWWFGISPEGIGTLGMLLNFVVTVTAREVSFQAYSRLVFDDPEDGTPHNVNVLSFRQDADADGFEDLIAR